MRFRGLGRVVLGWGSGRADRLASGVGLEAGSLERVCARKVSVCCHVDEHLNFL